MSQLIRKWSGRLSAAVSGIFIVAILMLASAAPVLAKTFHGGAHGRANRLVESGYAVPLRTTDLIAFGVAAAVACAAVAVERRISARRAPSMGRARRRSAPNV
jgi:hypothetical protein